MTLSPGDNPEARSRLEELGYSQELKRRLKMWHVVGLAMADVSPTMAVLFLTAGVFFVGGTFALGANLILAVVVVLIALCLAELAAMYPIAGGMYSLVRYVLPGPITWITMFNYLLQGIVIPASIALGVATFLQDLVPALDALPVPLLALISLAVATVIALMTIEVGAWLTFIMVVVELVVLGLVTVAAFANPNQNLAEVVFHPVVLHDGSLAAVGFGVMLATLAPAFNVINGYDATLGFSEEMIGGERSIPKAVVSAAVLASLFIIVPLIAAVVAAPDLKAFFNADAPIVYSVEQAMGRGAGMIVDFGASIALFNAMLSLLMYFGRGVYTTGRDGIWPPPVSRVLARVNRFGVPAAGVLALAVPAAILIFLTALDFLIIFAGTMIAAVYFCIGLAALWSRISQRDEPRPYRMPLWPLTPIVVVVFTGVALVLQGSEYLIAELVLAAVAVALWAVSKTWSGAQRSTETPAEAER
ncbi:MAG TPA: APC family permease [Rubrobacteraceae bacterium]|nr:APC family permease [Rubrobacteraceae bacterium]